jgi:hypothetical protein
MLPDHLAVVGDLDAKHALGGSTRTSHLAWLLRWLVGSPPKGAPWRGRQVDKAHTEWPLSGVEEEKCSWKLVNHACQLGELFFRPSTGGTGRVHPDLAAKIGRSASGCRVPGAARDARGRCPAR